jgi:hypothetical protein
VHTVAPGPENVPTEQLKQREVPVAISYKPAVQLVQLLAATPEYVPVAQLRQVPEVGAPTTDE